MGDFGFSEKTRPRMGKRMFNNGICIRGFFLSRTVIKIDIIKGVARLSSRMFYDDKAHNMRAFFPIADVEY